MSAFSQAWSVLKALRREEEEPEEEFDPASFNYAEALSQLMSEQRALRPAKGPHDKSRRQKAFDAAMQKLREQSDMAIAHKNEQRTAEVTARNKDKYAAQDAARAARDAQWDQEQALREHQEAMPSVVDDEEMWDEWRKIDPRNEGMEEEDEPASEPAPRRRQIKPARGRRGGIDE